jgi:xanthine dehydrogenase YagT iron-sulfur-binding subunit
MDTPHTEPEHAEAIDASSPGLHLNRRELVASGAAVTLAASIGLNEVDAAPAVGASGPLNGTPSATVPIHFMVNGKPVALEVDARSSLLDVLREKLELTGAKKGCDHGQCGACTVHVDRQRVASCLTMAAQADGRQVTTIEGIEGPGGELHPMQQAFIDHDALQCGYCTPGQIMAAIACVREGNAKTPAQIREYMSGNICRCGAYAGIVGAIQQAAPLVRRF